VGVSHFQRGDTHCGTLDIYVLCCQGGRKSESNKVIGVGFEGKMLCCTNVQVPGAGVFYEKTSH
jgi:hypothetical protein